jgi:integrator complex subunit 9
LDCGLELCTSNGVHYKLPAFNGVDLSAVDVLLVSNYFNITALPFLTEYMNFKGRIYATLPSVQFGKFV